MFQFWKRKTDEKIADTLEAVVDGLYEVFGVLGVINRKVSSVMASQAEFNQKIDALSGVVVGIGANQAAFSQVVANFETVTANLKDQLAASEAKNIDVSALDAVLDQARTVKDNGDKILNPAVVTPPVSEIPTVPVVETPGPGEIPSVDPVTSIPDDSADDAEAEAPSTGSDPVQGSVDAPVTAPVDVPGVVVDSPADSGSNPATGAPDSTDGNPATGATS